MESENSSGLTSGSFSMSPGSTTSILPQEGPSQFSLEEIKKMTYNFSKANFIGSGTYGKVYRGSLTDGQPVAVKRAEKVSLGCDLEFKNEIELLSRIHHKNILRLLGFFLEKRILVLVYEYVPNGTLKDSLSGKSRVRLDWRKRVEIIVGVARGLAYLHEVANPPIIHGNVTSNNILLDEHLNAKLSGIGLSKPLPAGGNGKITATVRGTMGYLDPEYYKTHNLNEKSDVYSFGVLMLELISVKSPNDVVREVSNAINRHQNLYGLSDLLDEGIGLGTFIRSFKKYVSPLCGKLRT